MHIRDVWHYESLNARLLRAALMPASWAYAAGWEAYLSVYRLGLKKPAEPHKPVICIGNLQVGGSGKSPLAIYVAQRVTKLGRSVVMSMSGYGSPGSESATVAPEGALSPREWGDEPAMVRWLSPRIPLVVGRNRVQAAALAHQLDPGAVLVMDDGFQHLPLKKHATIVLDPPDPDNRSCLPAGPYREPRSNRARADLLIPGHFQIQNEPTTLQDTSGNENSPERYALLCALGNPTAFADSVRTKLNREPEVKLFLPDHDKMDAGTLLTRFPEDLPIVCSAKDWVKLRERPDVSARKLLVASHRVFVAPQDEFDHWLEDRISA